MLCYSKRRGRYVFLNHRTLFPMEHLAKLAAHTNSLGNLGGDLA